jgi:GTPase SAR1 family protein
MPPSQVHRRKIQNRSWTDTRSLIWIKEYRNQQLYGQDSDLGYSNFRFIQAGQESFKSITRSYYKSSIAAFLVFDLTKRDTFESLNKWLFEVKNNSHDKIQTVVIGNKFDMK